MCIYTEISISVPGPVIVDQKIIFFSSTVNCRFLTTPTMNELTNLLEIGEEVLDVEEGTPNPTYQDSIRTNNA
jgi:hypothetical protein